MNFINLTPHTIAVLLDSGETINFQPSGDIARVACASGQTIAVGGIPAVTAPSYGEVTGLPSPRDGVAYIVSGMVAGRVQRRDVFSPGTGPGDNPVRNPAGQIVAVRRLVCSA